jgi:hypothetical protein
MKVLQTLSLIFILLITYNLQAQRSYHDSYNRLGIQVGATYGGIKSDDFNLSPKASYTAGLTTRASVYNDFLMIYGVNFYEFNTGMSGFMETASINDEIDFKAIGVQINLFAGHKIIGEHLSIEAGPILQINSKWTTEQQYEDYHLKGSTIQAKDLEDISKVNLNVAANISGGGKNVKLWLQYQYGITNTFKNLNNGELQKKDPRYTGLKGNLGLATAGIVVYL